MVSDVILRALKRRVRMGSAINLGSLRRTTPISDHWGADRGTPIDRYYIERFLSEHRSDVRGRVLEVMDRRYTEQFGADVSQSDVLDLDESNPRATIVADLANAPAVASGTFDCFILTQTLQFVFPLDSAIHEAHRFLRPQGVLLATVPAVSRIDRHAGVGGDFWRFTAASCGGLFGAVFGRDRVEVRTYGNVLAAIGFLSGLAQEELSEDQLDVLDEFFPVLIGVRAQAR